MEKLRVPVFGGGDDKDEDARSKVTDVSTLTPGGGQCNLGPLIYTE